MNDIDYMKMALQLAEKGAGWTSPNPMVGAVIVKDGRIIGQGYHEKYGSLHAERNALASCIQPPDGAQMYVTLEPCSHYGKQPPCVEAILDAGIRRVVIGSQDPNPLVNGKGVHILREHGVEVVEHVLQKECDQLNEVFFHYIRTNMPFVVLKYAMTLDGKIATYTGESKWVTGEAAREHVHHQRHRYRAIMVGIGTVLADDPLLTCRIEGGRNPVRIICDSKLRTPLTSRIAATAEQVPTVLATCCDDTKKHLSYQKAGFHILCLPEKNGQVDLQALMQQLGQAKMDSVLIEGGGTLHWSALQSGIVQKVQAYIAPKIFGGGTAKTPVEGMGFPSPMEAAKLKNSTMVNIGEDYLVEGLL